MGRVGLGLVLAAMLFNSRQSDWPGKTGHQCGPTVSTIAVGRYVPVAPATRLYARHMLPIVLLSMRMLALTPDLERGDHVNPRIALSELALNFAQPVIERWRRQDGGAVRPGRVEP